MLKPGTVPWAQVMAGSMRSIRARSSLSAFELLTRRETGHALRWAPDAGNGFRVRVAFEPRLKCLLAKKYRHAVVDFGHERIGFTHNHRARIVSPVSRFFQLSQSPAAESTGASVPEMKNGCLPSAICRHS